jgi:ABC-type xylose transport system permease subunit
MLASIIAAGLAVGAVYALIGVTYNVMFATSRVMSFTAGQLGMLGGVFGSLFALRLGVPLLPAFVLSLAACAVVDAGVAFLLAAVEVDPGPGDALHQHRLVGTCQDRHGVDVAVLQRRQRHHGHPQRSTQCQRILAPGVRH